MKIAGLDIGTTGCKLTVFDHNGQYLERAYRDYPVCRRQSDQPGELEALHEIDTAAILEAVFEVLQEMGRKYPDIAGIGVTSFGEIFVLTDEKGTPLHHAMLYTDPRGDVECQELEAAIGSKWIASITGVKPHSMYSIPKLMWMKRHRPEIYEQAAHAFLIEDLVVFHLTGKAQIDYSLAARTMGFDITNLCWSEEIFHYAGIDKSLMSRPVPTGTPAGNLLPEVARSAGLTGNALVVSISHDQVAAAVGAGIFDASVAVDGAGTVECITPVCDGLPDLDVMYQGKYAVVPYVIPGKYVCYAFSYTGGALIQWCVDTLAKKEKELAAKQGTSVNVLLENGCVNPMDISESAVTEPTGLLVLPHFAGAATPYMDSGSKGAILGLTVASTVCDIYRGCMEGVVYEMLVNIENLKASGIQFQMLHATGGGAKSAVWMQMKADILNIPITELKTVDAGTVGSAMLTGIVVGCFRDLTDAADHMIEKKKVYYPDSDRNRKYMEIFEKYRKLYGAVRPLV